MHCRSGCAGGPTKPDLQSDLLHSIQREAGVIIGSYERAKPEAESGMGRLDKPGNLLPPRQQPDRSMNEEEPLGEDLTPAEIHDKRQRRHPRTEGKGATP